MANISLGFNQREVDAIRAILKPGQIPQALRQATKRTTRKGRVMAGDAVRERLTLRKKYIDQESSPVAAIRSKVTNGPIPEGKIITTSKKVPLIEFSSRASKRNGVTVTVDKRRPQIVLRHAFKASVKSGKQKATFDLMAAEHKSIFQRKRVTGALISHYFQGKSYSAYKSTTLNRYNAKGIVWRLPIETQYGPSVFSLVSEADVLQKLIASIHSVYRDEVGSQLSRFTDGRVKSISDAVAEY